MSTPIVGWVRGSYRAGAWPCAAERKVSVWRWRWLEGKGIRQASLVFAGITDMQIDQDVKSELVTRLNRIEGQIRGIEKMLEDDRECRDIVTQIAAATKALETVGFRMLASGLADCIKHPRKSAADGYSLDQVEKLFLKLS